MADYEFSHYEDRFDDEGYMYLIAWYKHPSGDMKWLHVD